MKDNTEFDSNDEMCEDDINEYERIMEFNESEEENNNNEEETNQDESDEEVIADKPFSSEQIPQTSGEFVPYFKNITELFFFGRKTIIYVCLIFLKLQFK